MIGNMVSTNATKLKEKKKLKKKAEVNTKGHLGRIQPMG